jgi:hypothetical protein
VSARENKKVPYVPNVDKESPLIEQFGLTKYSEIMNRPYDAFDDKSRNFELKSNTK